MSIVPDPTKSKLLEAAGEEFAEKGFDGATVRSICSRAGVNVAAVNYHFGDKEQLYEQAVIEAHRCGVAMPTDAEALAGTPRERLRNHIRHFLNNILAVTGDDWHHELMMREMSRPTRASETLVREVIRPKFERLRNILQDLRPDLSGPQLDAACFSVVGQCLFYKLNGPIAQRLIGRERLAALDLEVLTDHITRFTLGGLGVAAGRSHSLVAGEDGR